MGTPRTHGGTLCGLLWVGHGRGQAQETAGTPARRRGALLTTTNNPTLRVGSKTLPTPAKPNILRKAKCLLNREVPSATPSETLQTREVESEMMRHYIEPKLQDLRLEQEPCMMGSLRHVVVEACRLWGAIIWAGWSRDGFWCA